jgi:hypothetical protein
MHTERITVVLSEGVHNMAWELTSARTGLAYAGSVVRREIVYERSRAQMQNDIDRDNPNLRPGRR